MKWEYIQLIVTTISLCIGQDSATGMVDKG